MAARGKHPHSRKLDLASQSPAKTMSDKNLRRAAFHEAGHAVVARYFGLPVGDHLEIADDGRGRTKIGSAGHLPRIDQITVRLAGVAAQDLFGLSKPRAGYPDHGKIIGLQSAAYARAREIIKNQKLEVEWLAELLIKDRS
jgi:ATP-dependent Zn protease